MKYIDADLLRKEIDRRYEENREKARYDDYYRGMNDGLDHFEQFLDFLQHEQSMPDSTKLIELWHEDKEMLKEKDFRNDPWRLAYNAFLCGFGRGIAVNKPKQPEVDLEKEIDRVFFQKDCGSDRLYHKEIAKIARHFYELGLNTRKE